MISRLYASRLSTFFPQFLPATTLCLCAALVACKAPETTPSPAEAAPPSSATAEAPTPSTASTALPLEAPERARAAAQAFGATLKGTLVEAMQTGGAESAVGVCQSAAPEIAERIGAEHGVRIGRVTLPQRNRNPQNQAQGWQLDALQTMQNAVDLGARAADQVFTQQENLPKDISFRMMRGLETEGLCTTCHGSSVATSILEAIAKHYPDDGATGFSDGDLRGGLWVEVLSSP